MTFYIFIIVCLQFSFMQAAPPTVMHSVQANKNGILSGTLVDPNDARITAAKIILNNKKANQELASDMNGEFKIEIAAGIYQITVEANGFKKYQQEGIKIESEKTTKLKIMLQVGEISGGQCPARHICL